jgi:hypothetical protein
VHGGELLMDLEPDPRGARLDHRDVIPGDALLRQAFGEALESTRRDVAGEKAAHGTGKPDLHPLEDQRVAVALERDVVDLHDLPALRVDDLPVEHVALQAERLDLGSGPRGQCGALDEFHAPLLGRERVDRTPRDGVRRSPRTDQQAVHHAALGVHAQVVHAPDARTDGVVNGQAENLGEVDHRVGLRQDPISAPTTSCHAGFTIQREIFQATRIPRIIVTGAPRAR